MLQKDRIDATTDDYYLASDERDEGSKAPALNPAGYDGFRVEPGDEVA
jgi:hypothetical protein